MARNNDQEEARDEQIDESIDELSDEPSDDESESLRQDQKWFKHYPIEIKNLLKKIQPTRGMELEDKIMVGLYNMEVFDEAS
jgi:hypothetical protein